MLYYEFIIADFGKKLVKIQVTSNIEKYNLKIHIHTKL